MSEIAATRDEPVAWTYEFLKYRGEDGSEEHWSQPQLTWDDPRPGTEVELRNVTPLYAKREGDVSDADHN